MSLARVRKEIDQLDRELVKLLSKRMELALESKNYKIMIEDIGREQEVELNLKSLATEYKLDYSYLKEIYEIVFREGKKRQKND